MPAHEWSRVRPGIFHDFHSTWIVEVRNTLNSGLLPRGYYALAEQVLGDAQPDVVAIDSAPAAPRERSMQAGTAAIAVALPPPQTSIVEEMELRPFRRRQRTIVVRLEEGDRVVALIEIVSRGNKAARTDFSAFLEKVRVALDRQIHILIVDLFPPGAFDPGGVHAQLWSAEGQSGTVLPPDKPLMAVSYEAGLSQVRAYLDPFSVGAPLPAMPLFLAPGYYVSLPLEETYQRAFATVPRVWQERIQGP